MNKYNHKNGMFDCKICKNNSFFKTARGLVNHLQGKKHNKVNSKDYYDLYLKKEDEDNCLKCNSKTSFINLNVGYQKYCSLTCHRSDIKNTHADFTTTEIIKDGIAYRPRNCWIIKYGLDEAVRREQQRLKRERNSKMDENGQPLKKFSISKEEEKCYEFLCEKYGKEKIKRQVLFKRWVVDFLIEYEDKIFYAEYNGSFYHGQKHSFEELKVLKEQKPIFKDIYRKKADDLNKISYFRKCNIPLIMINDLEFEKYFVKNPLNCWKTETVNQQPNQ